jgi:hypothetical protein
MLPLRHKSKELLVREDKVLAFSHAPHSDLDLS